MLHWERTTSNRIIVLWCEEIARSLPVVVAKGHGGALAELRVHLGYLLAIKVWRRRLILSARWSLASLGVKPLMRAV